MESELQTQEAISLPSPALHIVGIAGSLRRGSYNRALLRAAQELAPAALTIAVVDLAPIPLYNQDLDQDATRPPAVERFKAALADADGLLIATPEFNHSIPGVLKNALDWASRPAGRSPMEGKPVAIMGATGGLWGTVRAQDELRHVLAATASLVMPRRPEILVAQARDKFDAEGRLVDGPTRDLLAQFLENYVRWLIRLGADAPVVEALAPARRRTS